MDEFGERLIILRENAWKIQKETIKKSYWFKKMKAEESSRAFTANGLSGLSSKLENSTGVLDCIGNNTTGPEDGVLG